jgi:hypothetical protein
MAYMRIRHTAIGSKTFRILVCVCVTGTILSPGNRSPIERLGPEDCM